MGAVHLLDVPDYNMIGGTVSSSSLGILATGQSNIDMTSGATVDSNAIGIQMDGGLSYGVLTMDCSRLLDNSIGVFGTDVALNIDASGALKTNHFRTSTGSPLFQICYNQLAADVGAQIEAKDNFWEGDINYLIYNPNEVGFVTCGHYYGNVALDTIPSSIAPSCTDPDGPAGPEGPTVPQDPDPNFTGDDPSCLTNDSDVLYDVYWDAYEAYLLETYDQPDNRNVSDSYYSQVASIPDSVKNTYPLKCRQLIHVARSRVSTPNWLNRNGGSQPWQTDHHNTLSGHVGYESAHVMVRPNPAKEAFLIELKQGNYSIRVFNVFGELVHRNIIFGASWVSVDGWAQGLYFIEAIDMETKERLSGKISIQ
jgi:hypothetical protein